ncbi:MAG: hypothetical protein M3Y79_16130 [Pseudomonadota bacterium]|nr:hypothetical protein [Pseudomonadota bacterium]
MIATNFGSKVLALAAVVAVVAGCDSIKDVRDEPSTPLPASRVVLEGTVTGVGSTRAVILSNNGQQLGVLAPPPAVTNEELNGVTPFTFGTFPVGTNYNVQVAGQPPGKICTVVSGGTGTIAEGVATNVNIVCNPDPAVTRYSVTVALDPAFASAEGAQVVVTTEDRIHRVTPAPTDTSVTFTDVLFNPDPTNSAQITNFNYSVTASTTIGGTLNKCPVLNPSGSNPTGNVTNPVVQPCTFTIGGTVAYSLPTTGAPVPAAPVGLKLQLRSLAEDVVQEQDYTGTWGGSFTFNEGGVPRQFVSNRQAIYYVAVAQQPQDMHCVVVTPMAILYAPTLTSNPAPISAPSVQCRETPPVERQLRRVYRHVTTVWQQTPTSDPVEVTWDALDFTKHNTASSNMIAFFENGTYIYGTHANITQIEHGFYNYDPVANTIDFTLNVDTDTRSVFRSSFSGAAANNAGSVRTTSTGLSAVPDTRLVGTVRHALLRNVVRVEGPPSTLAGTFRGQVTVSDNPFPNPGTPVVSSTEPDASVSWVLETPSSISNQMTGAWASLDSKRLWVFDRETYYGTHVGVVGVMALNDACFTMPDLSASSLLYTRRPSINGCYPWPRGGIGQSPAYQLGGIVESIDLKVATTSPMGTQWIGSGAGAVDIGTLQEYMARIPGGSQAADGRSPSPIMFHIATPGQFYAGAPAQYFPAGEDFSSCDTEILGIRATLNGVAIHKPVYFCRSLP